MPRDGRTGRNSASREPMFNAPWIVLTLVAALIAAHAWREMAHAGVERLALTSADLTVGRWPPLVTYMFVHAGWAHVLMNAAFTLAFGAPVARFLGGGPRGAASFVAFFLVCGVIAALAYAGLLGLTDPGGGWALVGASGAASGLMGAAARLIEGRGRLGSVRGRTVVAMTLGWIAINAVLGLSGLTPGAAGAPVAWEAHIFGFFAGLALIGLFARAAGKDERLIAKAP
ncbi:MAG TPA: rhomboid family intramembrane serine protease [Caulobacteraceae bacterium]|nr:rhomboid family intramembrane serine protease [Caulobacteraceae bacterium]